MAADPLRFLLDAATQLRAEAAAIEAQRTHGAAHSDDVVSVTVDGFGRPTVVRFAPAAQQMAEGQLARRIRTVLASAVEARATPGRTDPVDSLGSRWSLPNPGPDDGRPIHELAHQAREKLAKQSRAFDTLGPHIALAIGEADYPADRPLIHIRANAVGLVSDITLLPGATTDLDTLAAAVVAGAAAAAAKARSNAETSLGALIEEKHHD